MGLKRLVNFRHRRAVDMSPMVEDKRGLSGLLSSVFGEWVDVSPMTEVKVPVSGSVSSVFGDAWMGGLVASDGWGEFMHSEPIRCASSSRHARNSFLAFIN